MENLEWSSIDGFRFKSRRFFFDFSLFGLQPSFKANSWMKFNWCLKRTPQKSELESKLMARTETFFHRRFGRVSFQFEISNTFLKRILRLCTFQVNEKATFCKYFVPSFILYEQLQFKSWIYVEELEAYRVQTFSDKETSLHFYRLRRSLECLLS